jgi:hypothetical protein
MKRKILVSVIALSTALLPTQAFAQFMYACTGGTCRVYWCDGYGPAATCTYLYTIARKVTPEG